ATARSEFYRAPAVLPEVESSALQQDLYRRDFTINTLALRLGPTGPLEIVDFFGGRRDLEDGVLRVLHSLSFLDDPTRILRAVRLHLVGSEGALLERCGWRLQQADRALAAPDLHPHQAHAALAELSGEELLALLAAGEEPVREWVRREITELRPLRLTIGGRD